MIWLSCNYVELVYEIHPWVACSYFSGALDLPWAFFGFYIPIALLHLQVHSFFTEGDFGRQHALNWQQLHKMCILFRCLLNDRISFVIFLWSLTITCILMTSSSLLSHGNLIACLCPQVLYTIASRICYHNNIFFFPDSAVSHRAYWLMF